MREQVRYHQDSYGETRGSEDPRPQSLQAADRVRQLVVRIDHAISITYFDVTRFDAVKKDPEFAARQAVPSIFLRRKSTHPGS